MDTVARTANFLGDHLGTIVQFLVTAWLAKVARAFQVTLAVYGTRLETTREAMRRARVLKWLKKNAADWIPTMEEMGDWHAVNEVYLTPAAAAAFMDVHLWKSLEGTMETGPGMSLQDHRRKADAALSTLRVELLRFRKLPLGDLLWDWARKLFRRKAEHPTVKPAPPA
jgi:hypothetical protein